LRVNSIIFSNIRKENETEVPRPNSNPFSCYDIGMLGYTLNGYYLVNGSDTAQRFGVVFCQFRLPPGATKSKGILNVKHFVFDNLKNDYFIYCSIGRETRIH